MNIRVNGQDEFLEGKDISLEAVVAGRGLAPERVVVEWNQRIVTPEEWPFIQIQENDRIEIVCFVGGG